jgi:hypothetical protein
MAQAPTFPTHIQGTLGLKTELVELPGKVHRNCYEHRLNEYFVLSRKLTGSTLKQKLQVIFTTWCSLSRSCVSACLKISMPPNQRWTSFTNSNRFCSPYGVPFLIANGQGQVQPSTPPCPHNSNPADDRCTMPRSSRQHAQKSVDSSTRFEIN